MPVRRLRALATGLVGAFVATTLSLAPAAPAHAVGGPTNPQPSGAQTGIPTFSWDRVDGAASYDFQISTNEQFSSNVLVAVNTVQHQYVPTIELPTASQLWWRVRVAGAGENWTTTPFSRTVVGAPSVIGPADGAALKQPDQPVVFSWNPVPGALSYEVQFGTDPSFVDQTTTRTTASSSFVMPLQPVNTYQWRVRAVLGNGVTTSYSPGRSYTVRGLGNDDAGVPPTYPPDDPNFKLTDVVLDWQPTVGARSYQLQISTDRNFPANTIVDRQDTVFGTRYSPPATLGNDQYFWRVRPTDPAGFQPDWSTRPIWRFQRVWSDQSALGYPVAPGGGTVTVGDPFYYQWSPVKHASRYEVQVSDSSTFGTYRSCFTVHTTLVYGDGGNCWPGALGDYYWRVIAYDEFSGAVPHTDEILAAKGRFTYAPGLVSNLRNNGPVFSAWADPTSSGKQPVLSWDPVSGAEKYLVSISGPVSFEVTTAATHFTPRDLAPGGYRWQVRTIDRQGAVGAGLLPGSQPTFSVTDVPKDGDGNPFPAPVPLPAASAPDPSPATVAPSYRFPTLRWNPVSYTDKYLVYVRRQGAVGWQQLPDAYHYAAADDTRSTWLDPGSYEWHVEAYRSDGTLLVGSIGTFVITELPAVDPTSYRAAMTGNALTGNAGTTKDTCDAGLPATCQNMRQTPVLGWTSPDPNVGYYKLILSRDAELTNVVEIKNIANTMYLRTNPLDDSQAGSAYFWLVVPCTADDHCAALTHATHAFNKLTRPQTLVSPAQGATVADDVTLTWDDYLDSEAKVDSADPDLGTPLNAPAEVEAKYYNVQTASDQNFTQDVTTTAVDQTTFTSWFDTYPEGVTWWRVQAVDQNNNPMSWSTPRSFTKKSPVPVLDKPVDGATVPGDSTLSWAPQAYAASYDVEVYRNGETTGNPNFRVVSDNTNAVRYVLDNLDPTQGPYEWRVRRRDGRNRPGDWSAFRAFSVTFPGVSLSSPLNGSNVEPSDGLFTWQPVQGAARYLFERRPGTSGGAVESVSTPTTKWAPTGAIPGGDWQWRVTAYDAANHLLADSTWNHPFTVVDTPVATVPVSVTGSTAVDATLTANPAQWNMPNDVLTITYQWLRDGQPIPDATGLTYKVTSADVGRTIQVRATATRPGYRTGTSTSAPQSGSQAGAPQATVPVSITGSGAFASVLTLTPPTWDQPGTATTYQWFRGTDPVGGQTGQSYTVGPDDLGKVITVRATGTKSGYTDGTSTSNGIAATAAAAVTPTRAPSITGTPAARETLGVDNGDWPVDGDKRYEYQWFVNGTAVARETGDRYTVRTRDAGLPVAVRVTMTRTGFAPSVATTAAVGVPKLTSKTTATASARKITPRDRVELAVFVEMLGYDADPGTVKVMDGKKVLSSTKLKVDGDGHLTIRLKKLKLGKHKLTVSYSGSAATAPSQAKPVVVKVVKRVV
jgi:large repetitive protein